MHVLRYLADPNCERQPKDALRAEYRLLCSGTLHRQCLGDYSKSEVARILLDTPLVLFATSRPFDDYPLELAVQLTIPRVIEQGAGKSNWSHTYHPDEDVVSDLAALLSTLCRRLITVAGKANERHADYRHVLFDHHPLPLPIATSMRRTFWPRHPSMVITSLEGQQIRDYNPRPKAIDAQRLTKLLLGLPMCEYAESIVASCRLYALALELIHDRPDMSYPLLISSVETIANGALRAFQPTDDEKVAHQKAVYDLAIELELDKETARRLALAACKREWWATRKFKKFLSDNAADSVWTEPDELFRSIGLEEMPKRDHAERTFGNIYNARSKATHEGKPFPASASYTGGPRISVRAAQELFGTDSPFPPVVWLERVVNSALCGFWERSVTNNQTA
jgi:hypothetical protein